MRRIYSLRQRLVLILVVVVGILWAGAAWLAFRTAHHEADEMFDAQLVQVAETLLALVSVGESEEVAHDMEAHAMRYELPLRYQVWIRENGGERLVLRSPSAPTDPMITHAGFVERRVDHAMWRFLGVTDHDGDLFVVVGQDHAARDNVATEMALHLLMPMGIGLPLMALAVWWVVGRAMRPLDRTAQAVAAMSPETLAPVAGLQHTPREILPLIEAIDRLTGRVEAALENERRFTSDAAHELRTPLAALKVQAQVAARTADPQARERALGQVLAAVDRMGHLVEQLLTLARLEPGAAEQGFGAVDLAAVAETVCARMVPQADARQQTLDLDAVPAWVSGNAVWLEVLARNLVDNALRYTPHGGRVTVHVGREGQQICLRVADSGPGLSADESERLRGRFSRGEVQDVEGVGLGLSIIERVAQLHGGTLAFGPGLARDDGHGLAVTVCLPEGGQPAS
ncbi:two-component sensor histidine kinase [Nitrogeniibacter mangrovi]|uniref:histidine kinase n=1 Tax=Nitrogeniibacter mangrovi TaxID=2016596 RepID=A0A6C1B813_9RHOO|nr:ATP-binding protein [Nitrogeniibacter mangrovi]QID18460.1 two-component sensor histidine kinase [Nitrogeniibacter mangrovi]